MSATVHLLDLAGRDKGPFSRRLRPAPTPAPKSPPAEHAWLVDVGALARCRGLLSGHDDGQAGGASGPQSLLDVPPAYDQFCRSHFAAVRRLHPELCWDDACPAYAIALSAHALLCHELDEQRERQLATNWEAIRGRSTLSWTQARGLIADGCSALARLDPLAFRR